MKKYISTVAGSVLLITSACAPVYNPSARHTNLMDQKGELHTSIHTGTHGLDLQGGYAVSDRVGFIGAVSYDLFGDEANEFLDDEKYLHRYGELGVAWFKTFENIGRLELLGGAGYGMGKNHRVITNETTEGHFNKIFVQSNLGLETNILETGLALRLGQVNFTNLKNSDTVIDRGKNGTFLEPAVFLRFGFKNVKVESQLGFANAIQRNLAYDYASVHSSVGIHVQLNTLKGAIKSK